MREIKITEKEAGQRLDRYLQKYLPLAPKSFFYKMLRKKNITCNGKKAEGSQKLEEGDVLKLFFAEETLDSFSPAKPETVPSQRRLKKVLQPSVLYEDEAFLIFNKPAGLLSQKAKPEDISLVEYLISYLMDEGILKTEDLNGFRPSICNRLDRNTSGLVLAGKTVRGLQVFSEMLRQRTGHKFYLTLVKGVIEKPSRVRGFLCKDGHANQVSVHKEEKEGASFIETAYEPLGNNGKSTLLRVELVTGKPHQIRSHLAFLGHPVAGDQKYGDFVQNSFYRKKYQLTHQLLHAWEIDFPDDSSLGQLAGKKVQAPLPSLFLEILRGEGLDKFLGGQERREKNVWQ